MHYAMHTCGHVCCVLHLEMQIVVMQQMNHVLAQKALDGYFVAACDCGVNHREVGDTMHHNLYYHILLKRVTPAVPGLHTPVVPLQQVGCAERYHFSCLLLLQQVGCHMYMVLL